VAAQFPGSTDRGVRHQCDFDHMRENKPRSEPFCQPCRYANGSLRVGRPVDTAHDRCIQFAPLSSALASPNTGRPAIGWRLHFRQLSALYVAWATEDQELRALAAENVVDECVYVSDSRARIEQGVDVGHGQAL
jgi:hypothetical protein